MKISNKIHLFVCVCVVLFSSLKADAQNYSIKGRLTDRCPPSAFQALLSLSKAKLLSLMKKEITSLRVSQWVLKL